MNRAGRGGAKALGGQGAMTLDQRFTALQNYVGNSRQQNVAARSFLTCGSRQKASCKHGAPGSRPTPPGIAASRRRSDTSSVNPDRLPADVHRWKQLAILHGRLLDPTMQLPRTRAERWPRVAKPPQLPHTRPPGFFPAGGTSRSSSRPVAGEAACAAPCAAWSWRAAVVAAWRCGAGGAGPAGAVLSRWSRPAGVLHSLPPTVPPRDVPRTLLILAPSLSRLF